MIYEGLAGGRIFRYKLRYPNTRLYFREYMREAEGSEYDIYADDERYERFRKKMADGAKPEYVEFYALTGLTSLRLLKYDSCIFHGLAFIYKEKAWILTAPSGTGKTTQYRNWIKEYPEEIRILNGDKPALVISKDKLMVYPTPWKGKENYGEMEKAPLGGIIYLKQGKINEIRELSAEEGVVPIFRQFLVRPENREEVMRISKISDMIFRKYPVMIYENDGTSQSTRILREWIRNQISDN